MTATQVKQLTFAEFLNTCPDGEGIYELVDGELVKLEPTRAHKNVARSLLFAFNDEIRRLGLDYIVDNNILIRSVAANGQEQGRKPDVSVASASLWNSNVFAYGALTEPIQLAVEVTSTNWEDDYIDKLDEYRGLGILEYWIVDYLAIGSRRYLGNPKVPTIFVYYLVGGEYRVQRFTGSDRLVSVTFPELDLTAERVFAASQI